MNAIKLNAYPENTTGNGVFWDSLHGYSDWVFAVNGATANDAFAINVNNSGDSANMSPAQVQNVDGGAAVTSVVAPGVYRMTKPMPFRCLYITRSGPGSATCSIIATGAKA